MSLYNPHFFPDRNDTNIVSKGQALPNSVTNMSKCCVDSTGCTKGRLIDNNKSNISNETSTWWLVCYLGQDFKLPHIQAFISSFFMACTTCVSGFQLVWRSHFKSSILEICALVLLIAISSLLNDKSALDCGLTVLLHDIVFLTMILIIAHPLPTNWNTYNKPGIWAYFLKCDYVGAGDWKVFLLHNWRSFGTSSWDNIYERLSIYVFDL